MSNSDVACCQITLACLVSGCEMMTIAAAAADDDDDNIDE